MDWRDPDDLHRTNGAENDYYASLSPPYSAKNGPLDSVEDLLWIQRHDAGACSYGYATKPADARSERSPRIGLREIFTIDSPIDRVNLRTATAEVIHALTGIPMEKCRSFVEERKKLVGENPGRLAAAARASVRATRRCSRLSLPTHRWLPSRLKAGRRIPAWRAGSKAWFGWAAPRI